MVKDLTNLEEPFVLENKTNEVVAIRYYLVNFVEKLQPGDKIAITPKSSEELAYYIKIQEGLEESASAPLTPEDYIKIGVKAINDGLGYSYTFKEITSQTDDNIEFVVTKPNGNEENGNASFTLYNDIECLAVRIRWATACIAQNGTVLDVNENQN